MCLDWLKDHARAEPFYIKALALDPNSYYVVANAGVALRPNGGLDKGWRLFHEVLGFESYQQPDCDQLPGVDWGKDRRTADHLQTRKD